MCGLYSRCAGFYISVGKRIRPTPAQDFIGKSMAPTILLIRPSHSHPQFNKQSGDLTNTAFAEHPAGHTHEKHDHDKSLITKVANYIHFSVISSLRIILCSHISWTIVVVVWVIRWEIHRERVFLALCIVAPVGLLILRDLKKIDKL